MLGYDKDVLCNVNVLGANISFEDESQSCILVKSDPRIWDANIKINSGKPGSSRAVPGNTTELMISWDRHLDTIFTRPDLSVDESNV